MNLRVLIADDEPLARGGVRARLAAAPRPTDGKVAALITPYSARARSMLSAAASPRAT